ncbi:Uncharacterised protein g4223 [Pycnogonum litorale]
MVSYVIAVALLVSSYCDRANSEIEQDITLQTSWFYWTEVCKQEFNVASIRFKECSSKISSMELKCTKYSEDLKKCYETFGSFVCSGDAGNEIRTIGMREKKLTEYIYCKLQPETKTCLQNISSTVLEECRLAADSDLKTICKNIKGIGDCIHEEIANKCEDRQMEPTESFFRVIQKHVLCGDGNMQNATFLTYCFSSFLLLIRFCFKNRF